MAITNARMQMRRGLEADFDPDKMQPGEWAVSLDKKYVRMCFSVGVCVRMATYDAFEEDMAQIEEILSTCETIEEAVSKINTEVSANAQAVEEYTEQAKKYRDEAKAFRDEAESIAGIDVATKDKAGIVKPDGITIRVDEDGTIHADNGTVDYNELENKPSINGMELSGDKSLDELGIASVKALEETNSKVNIIIEKAELNIKNTTKGKNLHLKDSANGKAVDFGLYGKAEQKQYSGKQLIPYPYKYSSGQIVGITYNSNDDDGSMNLNGTTTSILYLVLQGGVLDDAVPIPSWLEVGKEYYISGTKGSVGVILYLYKEDGTRVSFSETKFTMPDGYMYYGLFLYVNSGVTLSNVTVYPMISAEGGEYEPYVGGIPSPNPNYPQDIIVAGESYNLLENTATTQTVNGVTFTVNEDESISLSGTATSNIIFSNLNDNVILTEGKYILSKSATNAKIFIDRFSIDNTYEAEWIAPSNGEITFIVTRDDILNGKIFKSRIVIASGSNVDNEIIYPMIRKASVKNDRYMPYGKGSVEVVSCGKNLWNNTVKSQTLNDVSIIVNDDKSIKFNGTASKNGALLWGTNATDYNIFLRKGNYILSAKSTSTMPSGTLNLRDSNETVIVSINLMSQQEKEFAIQSDVYCRAFLNMNSGNVYNNVTIYPMIRLASDTDDTFEPYTETISTIPTQNGLCGIKVSSGENYTDENGQQWICDEVVKYADGSGKRIQRIGKTVLNGTESWSVNGSRFSSKIASGNTVNAICSHAMKRTVAEMLEVGNGFYLYTSGYMDFMNDSYTTVADFKEWLTSNNVTVLYELAEPIITDLSAEEIAEIEKMHTFYPITNISNDADCGMSITYLCDSKRYIDNRIAELASALLEATI